MRPRRGKKAERARPIQAWKPNRGVVVESERDEQFALPRAVLDQSRFRSQLEDVRTRANVAPHEVRVVIKPDLELFNAGDPTGTDVELVEYLIDLLHDRGFTGVIVAGTTDLWDAWLENRDVRVLAELVGY